jgi:hypothetical protein
MASMVLISTPGRTSSGAAVLQRIEEENDQPGDRRAVGQVRAWSLSDRLTAQEIEV